MRVWMAVVMAGALLGACGNQAAVEPEPAVAAMEAAPLVESKMMAPDAPAPPSPSQAGGDPTAVRQIAYSYGFGFNVPTGRMEALLESHRVACESAGPSVCYVVSGSISGLGEDEYASGLLEIRARPDWVEAFRKGLADGLEAYGASVSASSTSSEDLTVQIIDTTARLNSAKTLRKRLQDLLADRPGKLAELLEIERELARVQAEIDSTESILAAMKARVAMSSVTLSYQPRYSAVSESVWKPLADAFGSFLPAAIDSLAGLIRILAGVLPWIVLLSGGIWGAIVVRRRRRAGAAAKAGAGQAAP